eukprot:TRINITY_DN547_c0_g1_i2.p1 TRINITY_DN547_c0_g1~~TRINITY_DN547_c0_g1_i2.p1  ORF type:complete len:319 (-),score=43.91 TRINITY_DN547_c0_g1_i2:66-1022(-)
MMMAVVRSILLLSSFLCVCISRVSGGYNLVDNFQGNNFFNNFDFWTGPDPTHGYVYYASESQAASWNLTQVANNVVYISADSSSISSGSGRASVRLTSKKVYNHGLFIFDVMHMPYGCGTWPAIWTVGPNWPYGGEIDVVEGVNQNNRNQMTLHSGPGCTMPSNWNQVGKTLGTDCNSLVNNNAGCAVQSDTTLSYGQGFNNNGGGVWAMQWESSGVFIWFWARGSVPANVQNGNPDPTTWGTPGASFPFAGTGPGSCPSSDFANHQIVIDDTFCGDWAGAVFSQSGCPGSCTSYVQNNPQNFKQAYWAINSFKVYQQ